MTILNWNPLSSTTASVVIQAMKRNFARDDIPDKCICDNGPQFDSHEYSKFARDYGFKPVKSSPYHSRGKGKSGICRKVAKNILKKLRYEDPYLVSLPTETLLNKTTRIRQPRD